MGAQRQERWTASGVRLRQVTSGAGRGNWLFVPGGPGLGSESLLGLVEAAQVPGAAWLVDLPGDGSNRGGPALPAEPYAHWPGCLAEAAQALDEVIMVGHSTGGMFMLSVPELEGLLTGMVLLSSAPHAGWRPGFARYAEDHPAPRCHHRRRALRPAAGRSPPPRPDTRRRAMELPPLRAGRRPGAAGGPRLLP
ncbi:alpha/beta fold hydrolase [Streptomyces auratus]|uniref:alpha/beta fold hydrolase n=1 Tax=Streptomyces auratus TaxID=114687 RepID=UPI003CCE852B